jgi:hypothetical protein
MLQKRSLITLSAGAAIVLLYVLNMFYFSLLPDFFTIEKKSDAPLGASFVATTISLMEHELTGSGGWLPNDTPLSPTWLLDNKRNFQLGVLEVVRYNTRVLRDGLSRQRTTDSIDADCDKAFTSFSNDPNKWIFPSAEGKYREGIDRLAGYGQRLSLGSAYFYPRSDNLIQLLEQYASLLGGVNTRLLNASRTAREARRDTSAASSEAPQYQRVPWMKIDDNFYFARGVGYGLLHMFKAVRIDFAPVLHDKNADVILAEIIDSLEETNFEPLLITNGGKAGIFANHSSNLRVFLDDARQKINSLMTILSQG